MLIQSNVLGTVAYLGGLHAVLEEFAWCWGQLIQFNYEYLVQPGQSIHYDRAKVSYHALARNELVRHMQGDFLLQIDTDHQFEPDILVRMKRLAEAFHCDVLTALYENKGFPHPPAIYQWEGDKPRVIGDWPPEVRCFNIGSAGAGTLFVRKVVFDRIENELGEKPFTPIGEHGEDHSFFLRCRKLNIPCYVAPCIESYHLALKPISRRDTVLESMSLEDGVAVIGRY